MDNHRLILANQAIIMNGISLLLRDKYHHTADAMDEAVVYTTKILKKIDNFSEIDTK